MDMNMEMEMEADGDRSLGNCLNSVVNEGSNNETHRYYLSRKTALEMLKDRGYAVPNSEIQMSLQDFRDRFGQKPDLDRLKISALHKNDPSNRILVLYCGPYMVKVNVVRSIAAQITNKETLGTLIIIVQNQITSQAQKAVDTFPFKVEIFHITDLIVNFTKHVLKPKHRVLTDEEKESLLKKYIVEQKQLPRMLQKDAIARYYGLEKGQVLEVTYNGEITGMHVTYRCVW